MMLLEGRWFLHDLRSDYVRLLRWVRDKGRPASPRNAPTTEVLDVSLVIPATAPMLPLGCGRKASTALAAEEALQVVGGFSDYAALVVANSHLAAFGDEGEFHGAYGPRLRGQTDTAVRRLREDLETRRAVITLWDPARDQVEGVKNYPCATELQFMGREGKLDLHVHMRANDAWHGLAYDAFVFSQLQLTVAREIGATPGYYYHHATSLHLYDDLVERVDELFVPPDASPFLPLGLPSRESARLIADGVRASGTFDTEWYASKCAPHREGRRNDDENRAPQGGPR